MEHDIVAIINNILFLIHRGYTHTQQDIEMMLSDLDWRCQQHHNSVIDTYFTDIINQLHKYQYTYNVNTQHIMQPLETLKEACIKGL